MIPFHPKLNFKNEKQIVDKNGRYIILDGMFADNRTGLVNIYAPNDAINKSPFSKNYKIGSKNIQMKQS